MDELISHESTFGSCFMQYHKRAKGIKSFKSINIVTDYVYYFLTSFVIHKRGSARLKQDQDQHQGDAL